ncbi:MAG: kinase [Thermogladius sp.]|nr:kinase [Thermogladius sp.]
MNPSPVVKVPLHVSGLWAPVLGGDLLHTGSIGAGLVLDIWVTSKAVGGGCWIELNGRRVLQEHASRICGLEGSSIGVSAVSPIDLGKGFAVSSALSLSLSTHISLGKKGFISEESTWSAHTAEVEFKTGLGDVMAQFHGGFVIRVEPGPPGVGVARSIKGLKPTLVVAELPGVEPTPLMLSRVKSPEYEFAREAVLKLWDNPDLALFFRLAREFTMKLFDYTRAVESLKGARGLIGFYVKKRALVAWVEDEWAEDLVALLESNKLNPFKTTLSDEGVSVVHPAQSPQA